jgi:hypothetical protein
MRRNGNCAHADATESGANALISLTPPKINPTGPEADLGFSHHEEPMSTAAPIERPAIQSLTLRSAAAIAIAAAASELGLALPEGAAHELAGALIDLIVTLGLIGVAVGRARARGPIV